MIFYQTYCFADHPLGHCVLGTLPCLSYSSYRSHTTLPSSLATHSLPCSPTLLLSPLPSPVFLPLQTSPERYQEAAGYKATSIKAREDVQEIKILQLPPPGVDLLPDLARARLVCGEDEVQPLSHRHQEQAATPHHPYTTLY